MDGKPKQHVSQSWISFGSWRNRSCSLQHASIYGAVCSLIFPTLVLQAPKPFLLGTESHRRRGNVIPINCLHQSIQLRLCNREGNCLRGIWRTALLFVLILKLVSNERIFSCSGSWSSFSSRAAFSSAERFPIRRLGWDQHLALWQLATWLMTDDFRLRPQACVMVCDFSRSRPICSKNTKHHQ